MTSRAAILALVCCATAARADSPAPSAALAALLARTDAVAKEVARIRKLPLRKKIANEVVDRAELRARLEKLAADRKTADETAAEGLALVRWGLLPPDLDYTHLMIDVLADEIAGYYDSKTKKLTISESAGENPQWAELVLAHELDHGLQDQSFDLEKFQDLPASEGDALTARHALVEGDGIALMLEVMFAREHKPAPWGDPAVVHAIVGAMTGSGDATLDKAPLVVREAMLFPYRDGFAFVAALRRRAPWSAVDAAFRRPPRSTEQILHPEKYLADEKPIAIAAAAPALAGYTIAHSTVWGELGFQLFLRAHGVAQAVATEAAAGWGGDRVIVLARDNDRDPTHAIGLARFEWDSEADAIEAEHAATRAVDDALVGATAERAGDAGGRTRWLAVDGSEAWVERRGSSLELAIGVPVRAADALATEAWTALAPRATHASK
ncbi:MAG TPA: hypothetical protein VMJ10_19140 [Kofleriaceae bacterium]|nr:hypothetical protein [Kofleriaceae bacterium]